MRCHSCGTEVREGQKFCMECGASLRGVADVTGEVPVIRSTNLPPDTLPAGPTRQTTAMPPPTDRPSPPPPVAGGAGDHTMPMAASASATSVAAGATSVATQARSTDLVHVVEATSPPVDLTTQLPAVQGSTAELAMTSPPAWNAQVVDTTERQRRFRLRALLLVAVLAAGATAVAVLTTLMHITPAPDNRIPNPGYTVNDFGTNNTVAALIASGTMVLGALLWCAGHRWGAGLAGGAGAALAGWAALLVGLAEWPMSTAAPDAVIDRSFGYWALWVAGGLGLVALVLAVARSGRDGRGGLDPWIAALAAVSFVIAAGGPLIPQGAADWSGNWSNDTLGGVDLPTLFFVGRGVQLGLLVLCGVAGCLLVRRWGLGLAIGSATASGWLLATAATHQTRSPIGPAYANPGSLDLEPHGVTIVGFALVGFFALVAVVMALLDADR